MDDVIRRHPRPARAGRAEVSLTIDNTANLLPIEFSEVTITRTLFRNGDSEYAINGAPCRLLDIQDLLSDTGIGRQQHVIVGQGQLDAVLTSRPEDRRAVIEEAAGVLKYRKRRERAERRLESTEGNLLRLNAPAEVRIDAPEAGGRARRHDGSSPSPKIRLYLGPRAAASKPRRRIAAPHRAGGDEAVIQARCGSWTSGVDADGGATDAATATWRTRSCGRRRCGSGRAV
jgi:hypothetical protein